MDATPNSGNSSGNGADRASPAGNADAREKLMNNMKTIIGDAESWLKSSAAQSGPDMQAMKEQFEDTLKTAKTDLLHIEANMLARTKLAAMATDTYVKDNPWQSVGLGAVVGLLFGYLLTRR